MPDDDKVGAEAQWGDKKVVLKGRDWSSMVAAVCGVITVTLLSVHWLDTREGRVEMVSAIKEQAIASSAAAKSTDALTTAQKFQNCIIVHRQRFKSEEWKELEDFCGRR
jgi:hypothetical protein